MRLIWVIGFVALALIGCDSEDNDGDAGASGGGAGVSGGDGDGDGDTCGVTAPTECPSDMPTYDDVEPIFAERCIDCHAGGGGGECPTCWGLDSYTDIKHWTAEIRNVMLQCAMPPPGSGKTMTDDERVKLLEWIRCGAPE